MRLERSESQASKKVGIFTLKTTSPDYEKVLAQLSLPSVLAMVKGRGMSAVSGEITEAKLVQAYVSASSAAGVVHRLDPDAARRSDANTGCAT